MNFLLHPTFLIVNSAVLGLAVLILLNLRVRALALALAKQPAFVAATVVLLVAALGLNTATAYMQLHFKKLPIPPARELTLISDTFGPWRQVTPDDPLPGEVQEALGTDRYVFRTYIDERVVGAETIERFRDRDARGRHELLAEIQANHPHAIINVAVTYYTGLVDTVAHIPDRCYIADGYEPSHYVTPRWMLADPAGGGERALDVRLINFEDQQVFRRVPRNVAYFFHVNGRYESSPLGVRRALQNLFERYGYYAKIELMTTLPDVEQSSEVMIDFLSEALPEIERSWPNWESAIAGR